MNRRHVNAVPGSAWNRLAALALVALAPLAVASAPAEEGAAFGQGLELQETTPIADLLARPHEFEGKLVQVEGEVKEVCAAMGCWLRIDAGEAGTLLARSSGDKVTIPTDSAGRRAVVEGIVVVEQAAEEADAEGGAGHTCPTAVVRLETRGVVLK